MNNQYLIKSKFGKFSRSCEIFFKTYPVTASIIFFIVTALVVTFYHNIGTFSVLAASFGSIFVALKYKLDQANYHKDLFEERYAILVKLDEIIFDFNNGEDWRILKQKLDSIYRKSYCLFGQDSYQFIEEFGKAIITSTMLRNSTDPNAIENKKNADEFIIDLLDGQNLSRKLSEIKIDTY